MLRLLNEISNQLTNEDLKVLSESWIFDEIKKIVNTGFAKSMDKISHDIHSFATQKLHTFDRASKEFVILNKIVANPKVAVSQLIKSQISENLPILK